MTELANEGLAGTLTKDGHKNNIAMGAIVQAIFTTLSRIFGMIRDIVLFHIFGVGFLTDAFLVAFTIPNVMLRFLGERALGIAFVPVYMSTKESEGEPAARQFFRDSFGVLMLVLGLITLLGILSSKALVYFFAVGFSQDQSQFALTNSMTKWLFPYVAMVSLVALFGAYLQCYGKFAAMSAAPILLNIAMIFAMIFMPDFFEPRIFALAIGVLLGGILQILLMVINLKREGLWAWPTFSYKTVAMHKLLTMLGPALFGVFIYQLNIVILRQLISFLGEGQISYYYNADRLTQFATGIFAVSISTAALPELSKRLVSFGEDAFFETLRFTLTITSFVITPCAIGLMFFAYPIVSVIYVHGAFTNQDAVLTAQTLVAFAPSLVAFAFSRPIIQAFYAQGNTKAPVKMGVVTVVLNFLLGLLLLKFEVVGIALTLSISSFIQFFLLLYLFKSQTKLEFKAKILWPILSHLAIAMFSSVAGLLLAQYGEWDLGFNIYNLSVLLGSIAFVAVLYGTISYFLKLEEAMKIVDSVARALKLKQL